MRCSLYFYDTNPTLFARDDNLEDFQSFKVERIIAVAVAVTLNTTPRNDFLFTSEVLESWEFSLFWVSFTSWSEPYCWDDTSTFFSNIIAIAYLENLALKFKARSNNLLCQSILVHIFETECCYYLSSLYDVDDYSTFSYFYVFNLTSTTR